jgi:large subunit ribosomal protein L1
MKTKTNSQAPYRSKLYPLTEALELLTKLSKGKKTNTVELHINTLETGIKGEVSLPHSTGKKQTIEVFSDKTIVKINAGKLDFTILLATSADMPKLAKYAKVLGPKGLMPTPKNNNLTEDTKKRLEELSTGATLAYKTEPKFPIIHLSLGPVTQKLNHLQENIQALVKHINPMKIKSAFLTSTQTPAIKLEF